MITKGTIECSFCRKPFRAWFQAGTSTVVCPTCWVDVDLAAVQMQPKLVAPASKVRPLTSVLRLIRDRLVGYNGSCPDGLTL
jgi:hypothetical protein